MRSCSKSRDRPAASSRSHCRGDESRHLLLRPVEAEHFAQAGIGARNRQFVQLLASAHRGDAENAVQLVEPHQPVDDVLAGAQRFQPGPAGRSPRPYLGADQRRRGAETVSTPGFNRSQTACRLVSPAAARITSPR